MNFLCIQFKNTHTHTHTHTHMTQTFLHSQTSITNRGRPFGLLISVCIQVKRTPVILLSSLLSLSLSLLLLVVVVVEGVLSHLYCNNKTVDRNNQGTSFLLIFTLWYWRWQVYCVRNNNLEMCTYQDYTVLGHLHKGLLSIIFYSMGNHIITRDCPYQLLT